MKYRRNKTIATICLAGALLLSGCGGAPSTTETENDTPAVQKEESATSNEPTKESSSEEKTESEQKESTSETNSETSSNDKQETKNEPEKNSSPTEKPSSEQPASTKKEEPATSNSSNEPKESEQKPKETPAEEKPAAPAPVEKKASKYKDGTFAGSAEGYNGSVNVNVTIQSDKITSVTISGHSDDEAYMADAEAVIGKIIQAQSADVDSVSGATYSSDGIKNAVKSALEKAKN